MDPPPNSLPPAKLKSKRQPQCLPVKPADHTAVEDVATELKKHSFVQPFLPLFQSHPGPPLACPSHLVVMMGEQTMALAIILAAMGKYDDIMPGNISLVQEAIQHRHNIKFIAHLFGYENSQQFLFHVGRLVLTGGDLFDIVEASLPMYIEPVLNIAFQGLENAQFPCAATTSLSGPVDASAEHTKNSKGHQATTGHKNNTQGDWEKQDTPRRRRPASRRFNKWKADVDFVLDISLPTDPGSQLTSSLMNAYLSPACYGVMVTYGNGLIAAIVQEALCYKSFEHHRKSPNSVFTHLNSHYFLSKLAPFLGICVDHLVSSEEKGGHVKACIGSFTQDYECFYKTRYALFQLLAPIIDLFFRSAEGKQHLFDSDDTSQVQRGIHERYPPPGPTGRVTKMFNVIIVGAGAQTMPLPIISIQHDERYRKPRDPLAIHTLNRALLIRLMHPRPWIRTGGLPSASSSSTSSSPAVPGKTPLPPDTDVETSSGSSSAHLGASTSSLPPETLNVASSSSRRRRGGRRRRRRNGIVEPDSAGEQSGPTPKRQRSD